MSWFADLAGKAESLLTNLDEQTGAALRNNNVVKQRKHDNQPTDQDSPKRHTQPRNVKRNNEIKHGSANKKSTQANQGHQNKNNKDIIEIARDSLKKKYIHKKKPNQNSLNSSPKIAYDDDGGDTTMVEAFGLRQRRNSLPCDLELIAKENISFKVQNLEIENDMLKKELHILNKEVSDLLERLRKTEDELIDSQMKLEAAELSNQTANSEKKTVMDELNELKNVLKATDIEVNKHRDLYQKMELEMLQHKERERELVDRISHLNEQLNERNNLQKKLENELRHAQTVKNELQIELEKTNSECKRLENDWEAYKVRVKNMLLAKNNEIKALHDNLSLTKETTEIVDQLEILKAERENLSASVATHLRQCEELQKKLRQLELRNESNERTVVALREALREERSSKNRAEVQLNNLNKEFKSLQIENAETITNLRTALREKESEINHLKTSQSTLRSIDSSALNVGDYDNRASIDSEKVQYLTQTLIQKQGKIDNLMAENNMMKIQLQKLESKFKSEMASLRASKALNVQMQEERKRLNVGGPLSRMSLRLGVMMKRVPALWTFVVFYMIGLHLWVMTVLFSSTPEGFVRTATV